MYILNPLLDVPYHRNMHSSFSFFPSLHSKVVCFFFFLHLPSCIFQMRKIKLRKLKKFSQGTHLIHSWTNLNLKSESLKHNSQGRDGRKEWKEKGVCPLNILQVRAHREDNSTEIQSQIISKWNVFGKRGHQNIWALIFVMKCVHFHISGICQWAHYNDDEILTGL